MASLAAVAPCAACASHAAFEPAAHQAYPQFGTEGGPTLASSSIVTIAYEADPNATTLAGFTAWLGASGFLPQMTREYGVRSVSAGPSAKLGGMPAATLTDGDVQSLLSSALTSGTIPSSAPSGSSPVYVLFLPSGTSVTRNGADTCMTTAGNGYHDATQIAGRQVVYAVVPDCFPRFSAVVSEVGGMQLEAARLLVDALTDPSPQNEPAYELSDVSSPWIALGQELGDFCSGRLTQEGDYTLQRVWSNRAAASGGEPCVPTPKASVAFGIATMASGAQTVKAGVPSTFTVVGWSDAPVADWTIQATQWTGAFPITATVVPVLLNNGQISTLSMTVPSNVASGSFGAVMLRALGPTDAPAWPFTFAVQ
jgi:hypothetical protein